MKAIIFGANGQDGYYLNEICLKNNIETIAVSRSEGNWTKGDIANYSFVEELIKKHKPDMVFHVAANSTTRHSALFENHATISTGTLNLLEAVKLHSPQSRVFITGSGVQFKNTGHPISEKDEFEGNSAYSVARIQSVYAARYYNSLGIKTYVGYLFHHESPLRKEHHVSKMIALAVNRIHKGSNEAIEIGDITVRKEWSFAGDIAQGIFDLVNQDTIHEACIGSGIAYSIEDWLNTCFSYYNMSWKEHVQLKSSFKPEYSCLVSNPSTIKSIGWKPKVDFNELASIMLKES